MTDELGIHIPTMKDLEDQMLGRKEEKAEDKSKTETKEKSNTQQIKDKVSQIKILCNDLERLIE